MRTSFSKLLLSALFGLVTISLSACGHKGEESAARNDCAPDFPNHGDIEGPDPDKVTDHIGSCDPPVGMCQMVRLNRFPGDLGYKCKGQDRIYEMMMVYYELDTTGCDGGIAGWVMIDVTIGQEIHCVRIDP